MAYLGFMGSWDVKLRVAWLMCGVSVAYSALLLGTAFHSYLRRCCYVQAAFTIWNKTRVHMTSLPFVPDISESQHASKKEERNEARGRKYQNNARQPRRLACN